MFLKGGRSSERPEIRGLAEKCIKELMNTLCYVERPGSYTVEEQEQIRALHDPSYKYPHGNVPLNAYLKKLSSVLNH